jgi:hypothetical protein
MRITRFAGMVPALSDRHLPRGHASLAVNTRTTDGSLRAMREPVLLGPCVGEYILTSAGTYECGPKCSVDSVNCGGVERIQITNGALTYADGQPVVPAAPATPVFIGTAPTAGSPISFRATRIDARGGESAPSAPVTAAAATGDQIKLTVDGTVNLYALVATPSDGRVDNQGTVNAAWVLVGDFTNVAIFKLDPTGWQLSTDALLDEQCVPSGLVCMTRDEVGFTYAWSKSEIFISDRNSSLAWPVRGHMTLEHDIVVAYQMTDALLVLTTGVPFLIRPAMGQDGSLNPTAVPYTAHHPVVGGVENTSLMSTGAVYASRMGLIGLTANAPSGYQLLTHGVVNEEEWRSKWFPKTVGAHNGEIVSDQWVLDLADPNHGRVDTSVFHTHTFPFEHLQSLPDGRLIGFTGGQAYEWGTGQFALATYESELNVEQGHRVFTAAKIVGKRIGGVRFDLLNADTNALIASRIMGVSESGKPFRLPARRGIHYKIRLTLPRSTSEIVIYEVHIAPDINDLSRAEGDNA